MSAIVTGRRSLPYEEGRKYYAFVDMGGGGADDCVLAICHRGDDGRIVVDLIAGYPHERRGGTYNPHQAVVKFVAILRAYGVRRITLDSYAGQTFRCEFEAYGGFIAEVCTKGKTEFYEDLEVGFNSGEVEMLDDLKTQEQLLTLVVRGEKVDHLPGDHDDYANALAGCVWLMRRATRVAAVGRADARTRSRTSATNGRTEAGL
jgi:hypothetical protein